LFIFKRNKINNTSQVTNMKYMFFGCSSLVEIIGINELNTKNNNMNYIFSELKYDWLNFYKNNIIIEVNNGDYRNKILLYNKKFHFNVYFEKNNSFYPILTNDDQKNLNLNHNNSKNLQIKNKDYYYTNSNNEINYYELEKFYSYHSKKKFLLICIDNIINLNEFFRDCSLLIEIDLSNFDTSNVTDMSYMFYGCSSLTTIKLKNKFNTSQVTNMEYMFGGCKNLISLDLSNFDTSNVTNMSYMFYDCSSLKEIKLTVQI